MFNRLMKENKTGGQKKKYIKKAERMLQKGSMGKGVISDKCQKQSIRRSQRNNNTFLKFGNLLKS